MTRALLAVAFALGLLSAAHGEEADGLLIGSVALAQPQDTIGWVSVDLRPVGDTRGEFRISFVNAGAASDKPDAQTSGERAWVFSRKLAPGRYEVVRMQACLAVSLGKLLIAPSAGRASCSNIDGEQLVLLDVKPGAAVYAGRWHLSLKPQEPPEPYLVFKPSRIFLRDAYAEDLALLAAKPRSIAPPAAVENPIAALVAAPAKP